MLKRTKVMYITILILYFLLITVHVFLGIHDASGLLSAKGNISVGLFFALQSGGGGSNILVDISQMSLLTIIGSAFFVYLKNNNIFSNVQQRIGYATFLKQSLKNTFGAAAILSLATNLYEMFLINWFYFPFMYKTNDQVYLHAIRSANILADDLSEILLFIFLSAIGWGIFAILVFSVGLYIRKNAFYPIIGPLLGLILILLPTLGNMNNLIWHTFSYAWFFFSLVAPGQYTFISQAPPIKPIFAFIIATFIYLAIAAVLISVWYKQKIERE
ncbi:MULTISPECIES: hypothetical protein [unclassified Lactobacillus]|uniref:hypothetical protein n=1 Tax=unclassified Lactobacillus TaxID=2620435 RepID=UPI000EFC6ABC|nr:MULTISPECIES: hypothetical protein [unclassified Lactobacillus]RMC24159.1 hypothetical protein F5ESL0247_05340 [Lactobacillus sp. ESL0247]RMC28732.1 hypothetical protein F5ESL0246_05340 [Lactobacillus sp. ESL0246]RMC31389.1 hypothetical protein F5ESL0245_05345 [Lactobacillus sp. ESL0245]